MPRSVKVHFKGGPLGGETRVMEWQGWDIRVPGLHWDTAIMTEVNTVKPRMFIATEEHYRVTREIGYDEVEALWVHPSERLIKENAELKQRLKEYKDLDKLVAALQDVFPSLFGYSLIQSGNKEA